MRKILKSATIAFSLLLGTLAFAGGDVSTSPVILKGIPVKDLLVILNSKEIMNFFEDHHIDGILNGTPSAHSSCIGTNTPVIYQVIGSRSVENKSPCRIEVWVGPAQGYCTSEESLRIAHIEHADCE